MKKLLGLFVILSLLLASRCLAARIDLGSGKSVHFVLPASWVSDETAETPEAPAPGKSVRYITRNGSNDALIITFLLVPDDRFNSPENLRVLAEEATAQFVEGSIEGKSELKDFTFGGVAGLAARFTDGALVGQPTEKGNYKALTSCYGYLGDHVLVTANIFTDDPDGKACAEGMRILKSISLGRPSDAL